MTIAQDIIGRLGGTRSAAKLLRTPPSTIQSWKKSGVLPVSRILDIERLTGIPREQLRPDLFDRALQAVRP